MSVLPISQMMHTLFFELPAFSVSRLSQDHVRVFSRVRITFTVRNLCQ